MSESSSKKPIAGIYLLEPDSDPTQPWAPTLLTGGIVSRPTVGTAFQAAPGVFSWVDVDDDDDGDGDGDHEVVFTSYETNELLVLDYQG